MTEGSAAPRALLLLPEILVTEAHAPAEPGRGVLVAGERIEAIGSRAELERLAPDAEVVPLPGAVLIPGLVDAHSHLRGLSTLHHGIEDAPLERWIVRLHAMGAVDPAADALIAAVDAVTTGITTAQILQHGFGDASSYLGGVVATRDALVAAGLHAEVILGLTDQAEFVPEDVAAALPPARREWLVPTRGVTPDGFAELVTAARPLLDPDPGGDPAGAGAGVGAGAPGWRRGF
ncbi:MAG: hypothetical protein JJT89_16955 [Nitriliruptoraceae bacterium]|nr:hypothetical protein [Nitriliruptoraceae bacterium]